MTFFTGNKKSLVELNLVFTLALEVVSLFAAKTSHVGNSLTPFNTSRIKAQEQVPHLLRMWSGDRLKRGSGGGIFFSKSIFEIHPRK